MSMGVGRIRKRGFWLAGPGLLMLSCHLNGYGEGSQIAVRVGEKWYGWWSDSGWAIKEQKPLELSFSNGQKFDLPLADDGTVTISFVADSSTERSPDEA